MDNINLSNSFSQIMSFLVNVFLSVLHWLDSIIIIGDSTSLLDLNIALSVFAIMFVAFFSVVRSSGVYNVDSASDVIAYNRRQRKAQELADYYYVKDRDGDLYKGT